LASDRAAASRCPVEAGAVDVRNVERLVRGVLPPADIAAFEPDGKTLKSVARLLPVMP
jgi:hypothetical protein